MRMSLWRRAPREVYRVYGEDQYLEEETAPEGQTAPEVETAAQKDSTAAEPDSRGMASWAAFAADVPPASAGIAGSSSARPSGSHAGRLVGVGLLGGVGLATLALVFLNMAHWRGAAPEPVGRGIRAEVEQGVEHATGPGRAQAIAHSVNSRPVQASHSSLPPVRPIRVSGSTLQHRAPVGRRSDIAPHLERALSAALQAPGKGAPAMVAVEPPVQVAVESPVQVAVESPVQVAVELPVQVTVEPPVQVAVEPSARVTVEPSGQDEFGFER